MAYSLGFDCRVRNHASHLTTSKFTVSSRWFPRRRDGPSNGGEQGGLSNARLQYADLLILKLQTDETRDNGMGTHIYWDSGSSSQPLHFTAFSRLSYVSTMTDNSQRRNDRGRVITTLNTAIDILNLAKDTTSATPVNPVFGSVATLLTMIRVSSLLLRDETFQTHT